MLILVSGCDSCYRPDRHELGPEMVKGGDADQVPLVVEDLVVKDTEVGGGRG